MAVATLEDFLMDPESEEGASSAAAAAAAAAQMVPHDPASLEGVVVVETSDGEVMEVDKQIAFLSPILQLG